MSTAEGNGPEIRFYWDIGSTNTYFAFHLLRPLALKYGATVTYVPFNLGYVFRHHNYVLMQEPKAKLINRKVDLMRWANKYGLKFSMPDEFPIKTSRVLKASLVMREFELEEAFLELMFTRYWEENDATIQTHEGMLSSVAALGVDESEFMQRITSSEINQQLIDTTDQALADGIFGAPSMELEGELYWGKDRFDFVEDHLARLTGHRV